MSFEGRYKGSFAGVWGWYKAGLRADPRKTQVAVSVILGPFCGCPCNSSLPTWP